MYAGNGNAHRANWAVMWVYSKRGKPAIARKDFGDDLSSAEELYQKALSAGKRAATLACVNMGFPPPKPLRPYSVRKRGRDKRTRKIRVIEIEVNPLRDLNLEGKLWCPYCRKIRPFKLRKTFTLHGIKVNDPRWVCPICQVSHRDHNVRYWNPTATLHMGSSLDSAHRRSPRSTPKRRRRVRA